MDYNVDVSIICITYNHEKYIRQCLDGFIMQKGVSFEIIIHDDASTDGTVDIIREYEAKYPDIFKPIYQTENQYSKGIPLLISSFTTPLITGKYVALCEGDDYWTDPYKLKKQFDVLEANPDCYICFHDVKIINDDGSSTGKHLPYYNIKTGKLTSEEYFNIYSKTMYFHTSSYFILYDKYFEFCTNPPKFRILSPVGDETYLLYFPYIGNVYYLADSMSNYRFMSYGSWSSNYNSNNERAWNKRKSHIINMREMLNEFISFSNGKYKEDLAFKLNQLDRAEAILKNDIFWYCMSNKKYNLLFKRFSPYELKEFDLSNKAIVKMKLQSIFKFIKLKSN